MQPSYGHITSAIKPNCSFTIIYDFRLNQSYQYAGRQPAFLLRGPPGTAGTPGSPGRDGRDGRDGSQGAQGNLC